MLRVTFAFKDSYRLVFASRGLKRSSPRRSASEVPRGGLRASNRNVSTFSITKTPFSIAFNQSGLCRCILLQSNVDVFSHLLTTSSSIFYKANRLDKTNYLKITTLSRLKQEVKIVHSANVELGNSRLVLQSRQECNYFRIRLWTWLRAEEYGGEGGNVQRRLL